MEGLEKEGKELRHSLNSNAAMFPIRSQHEISSGRRKTTSEESEATADPVPGPSSGCTSHNCYQAGHHKVPLSCLDIKERFGQRNLCTELQKQV